MDIFIPNSLAEVIAVLLHSSFIKISLAVFLLGFGLGLRSAIATIAFLTFSFVLSVSVLGPAEQASIRNVTKGTVSAPLTQFMQDQTRAGVSDKLKKIMGKEADSKSKEIAQLGFVISQMIDGFELGLTFLIPFLIIDILALQAFLLFGVERLGLATLTVPFKLLLFISVDGWSLVSERLLRGYFV